MRRLQWPLSYFQKVEEYMQDIQWCIQKMYNYSYSIYKTTKPEIFCLFWTVFLKKTFFVFILSIFCCVFLFYILKQKRDELFALKPFWWRKYVLQSFFIFSSIARLLIQKENKMICCTIKKPHTLVDEWSWTRMENSWKKLKFSCKMHIY